MKKIFNFVITYLISIFISSYTFTIGIFTRNGRNLVYYLKNYYLRNKNREKLSADLSILDFSEILDNNSISIYEPVSKLGNVSTSELAIINGIILRHKPLSIFEIGTFDGRTTFNMAMNAPQECQIFTLNLPPENDITTEFQLHEGDKTLSDLRFESGARFKNKDVDEFPQVRKIKQIYGDSAKFDFSPYYNMIDLVFIDGAHNYEYVLNDSEIGLKLLRNGKGIILWHDYRDDYEVVPAIRTLKNKYPHFSFWRIAESDIAYLRL